MTFADPVAPGASVSATFKVTSPATTGAGFLTGKAEWTDPATRGTQSETTTAEGAERPPDQDQRGPLQRRRQRDQPVHRALQRLRQCRRPLQLEPDQHAEPVGARQAGDDPGRDEARERRASTCSASPIPGWRPRQVAGATTINVRSTTGFETGQQIDIDGETRTIVKRRDGGHGHDDGVHSRVHGAVDHDPRRLDQPAGHEREPASRSARRSASTSAATTSWPRSPRSARRPRKRPCRRRRPRARPTSRSRPAPT